ncbi:purine-cytosine permease family protein [Calidifontibacillus erzurumensis]|uniref:Cytosine permease n=1 Tax=Calidifontibacillus erzurumensis TaxID=2741433 RepID=A0A8J8KBG7_9BACI|nr:cytosine permease [Calidifontibacillus erzurumensis]NSL51909.1 cytosine permease [Calidifontibacillus erzurumensis]
MSRNIHDEVKFGFLPAKESEREYGLWDFIFVQTAFGIAAWCFLVGGYTGMVLDAKGSVATILMGNAFPVFLITPIAIYFARYGIDTFIGFRSALGYRGSDLFFALFAILNLGWMTIACFMLGQAAAKISGILGLGEFLSARETGAPLFAIIFFFLAFYIAYKGPTAIKWFVRIGVPSIIIILTGLMIMVIFVEGLDSLLARQPAEPYESQARSLATALEWNAGLGFSWLPYIGIWARLAKSENIAYSGAFLGLGVILNIAAVFGAFTALIVYFTDPTDWMVAIGGPVVGLIGLILLITGNFASAVVLMYSQAISFKTQFPDKKWIIAISTTLPSIILMLSPTFYDKYNVFLSFIGYSMAVIGGIMIADYFFVKKQQVSVRDLYNRKGKYTYWKGFNPASIVSTILSSIFYWSIYNPVADVATPVFNYLSASIPTFFVAGLIHYVAAKYVFRLDRDIYDVVNHSVRKEA